MNQSVDSKPRKFALNAIAVGVALTFGSIGTTAWAQDSDEEGEEPSESAKLGTTQVVGSRLGRASVEGALPVSVIDRTEIESSGFSSVGELLRNTVYNSAGAFRAQSGSSAQSLVAVDLRALGSERTLVLIDGRRAPKAPFAPSAQDLNAVPLAAVERIEILKDGAGAIYGSDAIGGVINIVTRDDFEGVEISYQTQSTDRKGGDVEQGSVTIGINGSRGNIVFGASYFKRDIIFARDSLYNVPGASFFSNNLIFLQDFNDSGTFDQGSEYIYGPVPGGCPNSNPAYYLNGPLCGYDFTTISADEAETGNRGLFAKGTYQISDDWDVTVNASINRAESFGRYAPSLNDISLTIPLDNPYLDTEALGIVEEDMLTPVYLYHRFAGLGPRDNNTDANVYDLSGIFSGVVGPANVSLGARYNEYKFFEIGRNYVVLPIAQSYIDSGRYNYLDPGSNDEDTLNSMKATINRVDIWKTEEAFAGFDMPLFSMRGGSAQVAAGFEYRSEEYADQYDSLSEGGAIGGSAGNSAGISRNVRAFYAEALFPILNELEVTLAVRRDDYSDYGDDLTPSVRVRYQPMDRLTLRGSFTEGFRAPSLDIISQKPAFSAEPVTNDQQTCESAGLEFDTTTFTCEASVQINATQIANPDLSSEQSEQYSVGFAYDVADFFDFSLDYYSIEIEDRIDTLSPEEILDALRIGDPVPEAFATVERGPSGRITNLTFGFSNAGTLETSGLDFEGNLNFNLGTYGYIAGTLKYVHILEYKVDGGRDQTGDPALPEARGSALAEWGWSDLALTWIINMIGDQAETVALDDEGNVVQTGHIGTYITHDIQLAYTTPWNGTIAVGAINAFGKEPSPKSAYDGRNYNFYLYDQYGQQPYIRYTQRF